MKPKHDPCILYSYSIAADLGLAVALSWPIISQGDPRQAERAAAEEVAGLLHPSTCLNKGAEGAMLALLYEESGQHTRISQSACLPEYYQQKYSYTPTRTNSFKHIFTCK